jgi:ketosteroid isomerase-like protein
MTYPHNSATRSTPISRLFSLAMLLLGGCTVATRPAFDATTESAKLLQRDAEWANLATAGKDVEKIISYWTDDAVLMQSGQPPVEGKPALRAFVTSSLAAPGFKIHWVSQKPTFSPDGRLAYMRSTTEMTVPGANGAPMTLHVQGYTVWRIDGDGQWRCVVDIGTDMPNAAAPGKA